MGTTKGTSQCVTQLGTFANTGREQQGNTWELMQTWEQSRKGTIGNVCKHGNRATREQLGTLANTGTEQQGNNWERLQTWEQSNKGTCPLASASANAREERERETRWRRQNAVCENLEFCRESLAAAIAYFSFLFLFFVFVFSSSWFPYGLRAVCCTVSLCVFFCGEDGTLSLLF
jgi:hypothetical protein